MSLLFRERHNVLLSSSPLHFLKQLPSGGRGADPTAADRRSSSREEIVREEALCLDRVPWDELQKTRRHGLRERSATAAKEQNSVGN